MSNHLTLDMYASTIDKPAGSIPSLPIVITASVALLAVDATITLFRRCTGASKRLPTASEKTKTEITTVVSSRCESLERFVDKSRAIFADVQALEAQLHLEKARRKGLATAPKPRLITNTHAQKHAEVQTDADTGCAFAAFCDKLLLTNRIWKQEKELKALRATSAERRRLKDNAAFEAFCDRLLLWNRIWKLEREAVVLVEEKERIRRERVSAVTRAAQRMVEDVQKERMVEEFVKELVDEIDTMKTELVDLRAQHEEEVAEINGNWLKDYRKVISELERLKLAQKARLVEQDVSNAMEESLFDSFAEGKKRTKALEEEIAGHISFEGPTLCDDTSEPDGEATDVELDELSTSSTCVSSSSYIRGQVAEVQVPDNTVSPHRRRCVSYGMQTATKPRLAIQTSSIPIVTNITTSSSVPRRVRTVSSPEKNIEMVRGLRSHSSSNLLRSTRTGPYGFSVPVHSSKSNEALPKRPPWRV